MLIFMLTNQMDSSSIADTVVSAVSINWWMIFSIFEFIVIVSLLLDKLNRNRSKPKFDKQEIIDQKVDFGNLIKSSFHASELYDELIRKCHPDRFVGDDRKIEIATQLSSKITENRNNLKKLEELKEEAIEKLNIQ